MRDKEELSRNLNSPGVVLIKLKRKLCYSKFEFHDTMKPEFVWKALGFLQSSNIHYKDMSF